MKLHLFFLLLVCVSCNKTLPRTFIVDWSKSDTSNDSTFLLLGETIQTDSMQMVRYKLPCGLLCPPNFPYHSVGLLYAKKKQCIALDSASGKSFILFDFGMKIHDTICSLNFLDSYPSAIKFTLEKKAYFPKWQDTLYLFRYINMTWRADLGREEMQDWVWTVSQKTGVKGIYGECSYKDERRVCSNFIGTMPSEWLPPTRNNYYKIK